MQDIYKAPIPADQYGLVVSTPPTYSLLLYPAAIMSMALYIH